MIKVTLKIPGQGDNKLALTPGTYRIGSSPSANLSLHYPGVAPFHYALTVRQDDTVSARDLGGGTLLNGTVLPSEDTILPSGSVLSIGEIRLCLPGTMPASQPDPAIQKKQSPPAAALPKEKNMDPHAVLAISGIPPAARPVVQEIKRLAHEELLKRLNLKRLVLNGTEQSSLQVHAKETIHQILAEMQIPLPDGITREKIERELIDEAIGLGPLEQLIAMDTITEIMVNGPDHIYVEHKGRLIRTDMAFANNSQVLAAIERIVSPLGRRIDESSPMVDARLQDGSRVNAIIPPLALEGPSITIRKFSKKPLEVKDLIRFGSLTQNMADFLAVCVKMRKNIIISGGTGSGKTTLLNVLSSFLPETERIVTIEDAAELQLHQEHVVRLEARPPNIEGKGEVTIRDLVKNSLRMRPDRIVIGECRGGEALDMLQAMNTGHDGSLTTIHANSPRDALARLETLVLMAGFDLPLRAIREQEASAISIIVQISRAKDGSRKVTNISEITRMEGDIITMQDLFIFHQDGWSQEGKILGRHVPTGSMPSFLDDIKRSAIPLDLSIFTEGRIRREGEGTGML